MRSDTSQGPRSVHHLGLEFGPDGEFIREIGKGLYGWAFARTVRADGDDNIWAVDKGSDMIIKFNQAGRVQKPAQVSDSRTMRRTTGDSTASTRIPIA